MSENSHIDKIFRDGLGERNFSNVDAMWDKMETELDKEGRKKKPVLFLIFAAALISTLFFTVHYFSKSAAVIVARGESGQKNIVANAENKATDALNQLTNTEMKNPGGGSITGTGVPGASHNVPSHILSVKVASANTIPVTAKPMVDITSAAAESADNNHAELDITTVQPVETYFERMSISAGLLTPQPWNSTSMINSPKLKKDLTLSNIQPVAKRELPKQSKFTFEAVGGGDLIRLNRKAGFYAGLRLNKKLENGSSFSVGVNFANHTISDRYRVKTKPAEQRSSDARINSISSIRVPVYLQRQMGTGKFSMMLGLVPTYITKAEVYNVPNSYIGDPDPYRKFDLDDINRFNLLFGAGLRYSPTKWVALELSGSYGLTGMVKDGYKNLSRVNDNFKSIQLGVAFRLK